MNVNNVITGLHDMSEDEIREIYQAAYDILNAKREERVAAKMKIEVERLKKSGKSSSQAYAIAKSMREKGKLV